LRQPVDQERLPDRWLAAGPGRPLRLGVRVGAVAAAGIASEIGGVAGCSMVGSGATIRQVGCWMTSTARVRVVSGSAASSAATGSGSGSTAPRVRARPRQRLSGLGRDLDLDRVFVASGPRPRVIRLDDGGFGLDLGLIGGDGLGRDHGLGGDGCRVGSLPIRVVCSCSYASIASRFWPARKR
jgi:hypothetical protein